MKYLTLLTLLVGCTGEALPTNGIPMAYLVALESLKIKSVAMSVTE